VCELRRLNRCVGADVDAGGAEAAHHEEEVGRLKMCGGGQVAGALPAAPIGGSRMRTNERVAAHARVVSGEARVYLVDRGNFGSVSVESKVQTSKPKAGRKVGVLDMFLAQNGPPTVGSSKRVEKSVLPSPHSKLKLNDAFAPLVTLKRWFQGG
jgi:hypothetical protein